VLGKVLTTYIESKANGKGALSYLRQLTKAGVIGSNPNDALIEKWLSKTLQAEEARKRRNVQDARRQAGIQSQDGSHDLLGMNQQPQRQDDDDDDDDDDSEGDPTESDEEAANIGNGNGNDDEDVPSQYSLGAGAVAAGGGQPKKKRGRPPKKDGGSS